MNTRIVRLALAKEKSLLISLFSHGGETRGALAAEKDLIFRPRGSFPRAPETLARRAASSSAQILETTMGL